MISATPINKKPLMALDMVSKIYAGSVALVDVTLELSAGEFVGLTGPSGSGKSTLARMLVGLTRPTAGTVCYQGQELGADGGIKQLAGRRQIVFQNPNRSLSPRLTVAQIVSEPAKIIGINIDPGELLDQVGLARRILDRYPRHLSAGECQRVAMARALSTDPELLVLDEPVSALDPIAAAGIIELVQTSAAGRTVVAVSHNSRMLRTAGRTLSISSGRLVSPSRTPEYSDRL